MAARVSPFPSSSSSSSSSVFAIFKLLPPHIQRSFHSSSRCCILTAIPSFSHSLSSPLISRISTTSSSSSSSSSSPPPSSRFLLSQGTVSTSASHVLTAPFASDSFFASEDITWKSLGLPEGVIDALQRASFLRPSAVQAIAIPTILEGADVIMAAETGSGKTQAYLSPIFSKLLKKHRVGMPETEIGTNEAYFAKAQEFALILCPNAMLCEQVAAMGNALRDNNGASLLKISVVSGGQGWPISPPDIVVATPAALLNHLFAYDPRRRRRNAFVRDVKFVVFDEADMLLSGGFENQVMRLIHMFRLKEKQAAKSAASDSTSDSVDFRPWTEFECSETITEDTSDAENNDDGLDEEYESSELDEGEESMKPKDQRRKDWQRSRKLYTRSKQYIFAAATLPDSGRKTPGAVLKKLIPEAKWVNGNFLHRRNPRLQEHWVEVNGSTQVQALLDALSSVSSNNESLPSKTLVFANSVEATDAICRILKKTQTECLCYHREMTSEERAKNLNFFEESGGILVCTDSAARGLDIHNVNHVIQAEFAKSAVDYLHRVGRTARAGQFGVVTSLYTAENRALVEAVKQAEEAGLSVESVFSRKRSFRNKLKKAAMIAR